MYYVLLFIHILVCIIMIVSILMQAGKGGGLAGGAFGGGAVGGGAGGSQLFGGGGAATFLTKVTSYAALAFFLTCIGLWFTARSANPIPESAAERMLREQQTPTPLTQPAQMPATTIPGVETAPATETAPAATSSDSAK
jgi:preprotein translocase subunit SecG